MPKLLTQFLNNQIINDEYEKVPITHDGSRNDAVERCLQQE
jgi:hypothetical protein